jgi:hypothetical protein
MEGYIDYQCERTMWYMTVKVTENMRCKRCVYPLLTIDRDEYFVEIYTSAKKQQLEQEDEEPDVSMAGYG